MPVQNASQATKAVADDQTPQQSAEQLRSTSTDKSKDAIAPLENTAGSADQELLERLQFQELYIQAASEFKRLGWTKERSVQHVQKTYRMVGGTHLSVEQLRHLLSYLKALPTPPAE
jgi:hypothetical protein